jgi:serine/threonine protein kinase
VSAALGQRWGSYVLEERIAAGGMAEVFRARRVGAGGFSKLVCIKRMHEHLSSDSEFVALFLEEGRTGSKLRHRNIVTIDDLGEHEGRFFIAMEFIHGVDLAQIESKLRSLNEVLAANIAVNIAMEVLSALAAAHRATDPEDATPLKVVHRDVAPHNVLISFAGEVKLGDFGIARAERRAQVTSGGVVRGRFGYMPLEQLNGAAVDQRADLYALGVVLFEMLAGQRPFLGHVAEATMESIIAAQVTDQRGSLKALRSDISDELCAVVDTLLARDREDRFQSAEVVLTVLEGVRERAGGAQALAALMARLFPSQASVAVVPRVSLPTIAPTFAQSEPPSVTSPQAHASSALQTPTDNPRELALAATTPKSAVLHVVADKSDPLARPFAADREATQAGDARERETLRWPVILLSGALLFGGTVAGIAKLKSQQGTAINADGTAANESVRGTSDMNEDAQAHRAVADTQVSASVDASFGAAAEAGPTPLQTTPLVGNSGDENPEIIHTNRELIAVPPGRPLRRTTPASTNAQTHHAVDNAPTGRGVLRVVLLPFGRISIDDGPLSEQFSNARDFALPAGPHRIRATEGVEGRQSVTIIAGETRTISFHD